MDIFSGWKEKLCNNASHFINMHAYIVFLESRDRRCDSCTMYNHHTARTVKTNRINCEWENRLLFFLRFMSTDIKISCIRLFEVRVVDWRQMKRHNHTTKWQNKINKMRNGLKKTHHPRPDNELTFTYTHTYSLYDLLFNFRNMHMKK